MRCLYNSIKIQCVPEFYLIIKNGVVKFCGIGSENASE
jgi:hypothetical protein